MSRSQQTAESLERIQPSLPHDRNDGSLPSLSQASYYSQDISDQIRDMDFPTDLPWPAPPSNSLQKRKSDNLHDCAEVVQRPNKQMKFKKPPSSSLEIQRIKMPRPSRNIYERPYHVIADAGHWQAYLDNKTFFGVQYEIARLVSSGRMVYNDLSTEHHLCHLGECKTEAAAKTIEVFLGRDGCRSVPPTRMCVWRELEYEINALAEDELAGLGFSKRFPDWYGGKVEFRARLEQRGSQYRVVLEQAELGPSCRFTRRFGSMSFLRVKVPEELVNKPRNGLVEYFSHPFILCGRVFRSFYSKDDHIFLFRTNEALNDTQNPTHPKGMSLLEFLEWHNPLRDNANQTMAKWAARFGLGLSSTVPGIRLEPAEIGRERDIVSPTKSDMTDGCGFISRSGLLQLYTKLKWKLLPSAIQCRLGGAKGLLALRTELPEDGNHKVWLRPSQIKISYPELRVPDPAALIIDIFSLTRMKTPGHLTSETLINLAENGVPPDIFVALLKEGLDARVAGWIEWEGPDAALNLWCVLARKVKLLSTKKARQLSSEARVRGYDRSETELPEDPDEEDMIILQQRDETGAFPSFPEELVMHLLDAGFTPKNCPFLLQKLKGIVTNSIHNYVQEYSIDVPMSCTALLIPDPFGVLAPNEVQIKCREKRLRTETGDEVDIILGDVLLTRYPCKLPTDFQKFVAVEKPELYDYTDVIVCSVQGLRRMADLLAGGDYDGDLGQAVWQLAILDCFIPADLKHADEPPEVAQCFSKANETVTEFRKRTEPQSEDVMAIALQQFLLGNIRDSSVVGMYSVFHENATYRLGLDHPETIRLANMFAKVLDGSKTGLKVLPEVFLRDKQRWQNRGPYWKKTATEEEKLSKEEEETLCSRGGRQAFVMDVIAKESVRIGADKLREIEEYFCHPVKSVADPHLIRPWLDAEKIANRYLEQERCNRQLRDLKQIKVVVKGCYNKLQQSASLESVRKEFAENPSPQHLMMDKYAIDRLKASFAYLYDSEQEKRTGWNSFPWDMAMPMLCTIKAEAIGSSKTITMKFYERFRVKQYPTSKHTTR